jgi:thymidylate synthase
VITAFCGKDINSVYLDALSFAINSNHSITNSRAGDVYDLGQVYFEFSEPINQILLLRGRKFNPYFALIEAAWVLSGSDKLEPLEKIISKYSKFSDDGIILNGAYGYRMRYAFEIDQLEELIKLLISEPNTRRAVITLYTPTDLLNKNSSDIPCNTTLYFKIKNGKLDITVINRSNDIFLGIPYNVFVFNVILKYVAHRVGVGTGVQRHFTDCLHLYVEHIDKVKEIIGCNSMSEIQIWQNRTDDSEELLRGIIDSYNEIAVFDIDRIVNPYVKGIIKDYLKYKESNDVSFLFSTLPRDTFGLSAYLWVNALSSCAPNNDDFLKDIIQL